MNPKHQKRLRKNRCWNVLNSLFWVLLLCGNVTNLEAEPNLQHLTELHPEAINRRNTNGWVLMNELGCFQCHSKPKNAPNGLPSFDAPDLAETQARLEPEFISQFLQAPHFTHPGTRMPSLMEHLPEEQKIEFAKHISAFLMMPKTIQNQNSSPKDHVQKFSKKEGFSLFTTIGCAVCHPVSKPIQNELPPSLKHVGSKYQVEGLKDFLLKPQNIRKGFRMPDFNLTELEAAKLTTYLLSSKPSSHSNPTTIGDPEKGKKLFTKLLCTQCHTSVLNKTTAAPSIPIPEDSTLDKGCLATTPSKNTPNYNFNSQQLGIIRLALSQTTQLNSADVDEAYLKILRCNACHKRKPLISPKPATNSFFASTGEDLGDEGRIPPSLDGVGRKLTQQALQKTIMGELPVRPYMTTRMPNWGKKHAVELTKRFVNSDLHLDEKPTPRNGQENQVGRNMWGRALVGIDGLGCIQCHPLNDNKSLGIQAMDLKHSSQRLRAPWFRDYLINPASFRPGTRMPSFWPNGQPSVKGHGGSTERQIDSIWAYLNELDQSRLPKGMESKGNFLLTPEDSPIVFRTFMEDAGLHAIAVGFSQQFHAAFDSKSCRWAIAWNGPFLDAEATWDNRFTPLTKPLGSKLPWFPESKSIWKKSVSIKEPQTPILDPVFSGYRLNNKGVPSFYYSLESYPVIDQIEALSDGLKRTIRLAPESNHILWLVYESESITKIENQQFRSNQGDWIHVEKGNTIISIENGKTKLWAEASSISEPILRYRIRRKTP